MTDSPGTISEGPQLNNQELFSAVQRFFETLEIPYFRAEGANLADLRVGTNGSGMALSDAILEMVKFCRFVALEGHGSIARWDFTATANFGLVLEGQGEYPVSVPDMIAKLTDLCSACHPGTDAIDEQEVTLIPILHLKNFLVLAYAIQENAGTADVYTTTRDSFPERPEALNLANGLNLPELIRRGILDERGAEALKEIMEKQNRPAPTESVAIRVDQKITGLQAITALT